MGVLPDGKKSRDQTIYSCLNEPRQLCHLYLGATTVSEISNANGTHLASASEKANDPFYKAHQKAQW
jgi:hypothetical protein